MPPVKKYNDECVAKHDATSNVSFVASDFMKDDLPKHNDIILAFNIIHGLNTLENEELAKKVFSSLNNGKKYIILNKIKGIGGQSQLSKATTAYMALNLLHQAGGKTYTHKEVDIFVNKAGFKNTQLKILNAPGFGIVICTK